MAVRNPAVGDRGDDRGLPTRVGDLLAFVEAYKAELPGEDSHRYADPRPYEVALMGSAVELAQAHELAAATELLDRVDYDLLRFGDTETGGTHLMLRERSPHTRGWGFLLLNQAPRREAIVEVPHPIWDALSPELGIELYRRTGARAFLMAGAHRWAKGRGSLVSDVARNPHSLFHRLHQRLADRRTAVLQVHGFNFQAYAGYPDAVLSNGSPRPHPGLWRLRDGL